MPRSTDRALEILEMVGANKNGLTHGKIAQDLNIPKSSLSKLIASLIAKNYLTLDTTSRTYSIGPQVLSLARSYLGNLDIAKVAQPIIHDAMTKTGESAALFIKRGNQGLIVCKEDSYQVLGAVVHIGQSVPLYATAGGKAILAFLPDEKIDQYLASVKLTQLTPRTITDPKYLRRELTKIRKSGFAWSREEQFKDLIAIAAPVFNIHNQVTASISMPFLKSRLNAKNERLMKNTLRVSSARISQKLGADASPIIDQDRQ